jgi:hypothetical protein
VILPALLQSLPDDLKFLRWDGFPQKSLPPDFCPKNLVKLDMPHSHLEQLWEGDQVSQALCYIPLCFTDRKSVNPFRVGLNAKK